MSGQEFYQANYNSSNGISFLIGVNRPNNRQLWIADSNATSINSINTVVRIIINSITPSIDAINVHYSIIDQFEKLLKQKNTLAVEIVKNNIIFCRTNSLLFV